MSNVRAMSQAAAEMTVTPGEPPVGQVTQEMLEEARTEFTKMTLAQFAAFHIQQAGVQLPESPEDLDVFFAIDPDADLHLHVKFSERAVAMGCPKYHTITFDEDELISELIHPVLTLGIEMALEQFTEALGLDMSKLASRVQQDQGIIVPEKHPLIIPGQETPVDPKIQVVDL